jgi:hypothetical protein
MANRDDDPNGQAISLIKGRLIRLGGASAKNAALVAPRQFGGGNVQEGDGSKRTRQTQV